MVQRGIKKETLKLSENIYLRINRNQSHIELRAAFSCLVETEHFLRQIETSVACVEFQVKVIFCCTAGICKYSVIPNIELVFPTAVFSGIIPSVFPWLHLTHHSSETERTKTWPKQGTI